MDGWDRSIAGIATGQHGLLTRVQAESIGLDSSAIQRRLDSGRWARLHETVYRVGGAPETTTQRRLAAVLAIGPITAVSHRAAADLHGLWCSGSGTVEITTTLDRSPDLAGVVAYRRSDLSSRWVTVLDGVPCTTVARTLVDLGAVMTPRSLGLCVDRALGRGAATVEDVRGALDAVARKGRRGVRAVRAVLLPHLATEPVAGVFEARMARLLFEEGLPPAVAEYEVWTEAGSFVGRVDFAYPDLRLAIEVDGFSAHSTVEAFGRDRSRQNALIEAGWTVLRFTWAEVDRGSPHVAGAIRRARRRLAASFSER